MIRAPDRFQLSAVAVAAVVAAALLVHFGWVLSAGVAAVIAVGCLSEAWRRGS